MNAAIAAAALGMSSSTELSLAVKAAVMLLLGLLAARAASRARASIRHLMLAVMFAALVVLPAAIAAVPARSIPVVVPAATVVQAVNSSTSPTGGATPTTPTVPASDARMVKPQVNWAVLVRWTWIAGTAALMLSLIVALWRIGRIRRSALPRTDLNGLVATLAGDAGIRRTVHVLEHERVQSPLTCGVSTPAVILPIDAREWDTAALTRALVHELEHVRRSDWLVQVMARAACAAYWFNPLVWIAWHQLCLEAERACDDGVVRVAESTDYADQLVLLARRLSETPQPALLGMASRSDLAARVSALLDDRQKRGRAGLFAAATAAIAGTALLIGLGPVRVVARAPEFAEQQVASATGPTLGFANTAESRLEPPRRRAPMCRALFEAAEEGETAEIDQLLNAGGNLNCALDGDGSPLIAAVRRNRQEMVRYLLDRGADPNFAVEGDGSPLIMAAREGGMAIAALLLDRGANVDLMVPGDENALIQACAHGQFDVVRLLVARGADVNARAWEEGGGPRRQGEWRTPLNRARMFRHQAIAAFLIGAGARE